MAIIQGGSGTSGAANVDTNFQLNVVTNTDPLKAGAARLYSVNDDGVATGEAYLYSPETTDDYRLRVGVDRIIDQEVFCYANQNTGKHSYSNATLTCALSGGFLTTNASNITTLNTGTRFYTQRMFSINAQQTSLYVEVNASFSASLSGSTNTTIDFGLFHESGSNPFAPTDGVYFRATSAGLSGVINFNGSETTVGPFVLTNGGATFIPTIGRIYQFLISVNNREVKFWIDDVLVGELATQTGNPQPFLSQCLPWKVRHAIGGTAAGNTQNFKIGSMSIYWGDIERDKGWQQVCTGMGGSPQVQQGATTGGQLTTYALGAAPAANALVASTGPATNTLGGLYLLPTTIAVGESDYPLFAWLNPAGTSAIPGKVFNVTSIIVGEQFVTTAVTGGALVSQWAVGYGSTASTLATTEMTSFGGATTKIARKIPLGAQTIGAAAAIGALATGFQRVFPDAIPVNPGEYLHIILRCVGTGTSAGAIRGSIGVTGYFE